MHGNHSHRFVACLAGMSWCIFTFSGPAALAADPLPQLVVTTVQPGSTTMTIWGKNFDNGGTPVVTFDGTVAPLVPGYTAEEIVVELALAPDLTGDFLLTVETGATLRHFDAFGVTLGEASWQDPTGQVLIRTVDLDFEDEALIISGHNFDNGTQPVVALSDAVLTLKSGHAPTATEIVVALPAPEDMLGDAILTVKTGDAVNNYDAYHFGSGEGGTGDYDCGVLCKVGPPDGNKWTGGWWGEPEYFQLLIDYPINLPEYLDGKTKSEFPFGFRHWRDDLIAHAENMQCVDDPTIDPTCEAFEFSDPDGWGEWDYLRLSPEGILTIKNGYRWDGPSTQPTPFPGKLIRASMVHDALYDLMRLGLLKPDITTAAKAFVKPLTGDDRKTGWWNRAVADCILYMLGVEDDYDKWYAFEFVRLGGARRTRQDLPSWKYHAVASAGEDIAVDCATSDGVEITLDGGSSRFAVSWAWFDDDVFLGYGRKVTHIFTPGVHSVTLVVEDGNDDLNEYGSGQEYDPTKDYRDSDEVIVTVIADTEPPVFDTVEDIVAGNDPGECSAIVEYQVTATDDCGEAFVACDPASGSGFPVGETTVACTATDAVGNVAVETFTITVEDREAPVVTGITDPISIWPPNHKYVTFTAEDFVLIVSDNCTDLSLDDFVIAQATSDEPEDANGSGDGSTRNDIAISPDLKKVALRSERQGKGNGRVYTLVFKVMDDSGNATETAFQVHVPHSKKGSAVDDGPAYAVSGLADSGDLTFCKTARRRR